MPLERLFAPCATAQVWIDKCNAMAPADVIEVLGAEPFMQVARIVAAHGISTSDVVLTARVAAAVAAMFEELAVSVGDVDWPPLSCQMVRPEMVALFHRVIEPVWADTDAGRAAIRTFEASLEWLITLRAGGGCCAGECGL